MKGVERTFAKRAMDAHNDAVSFRDNLSPEDRLKPMARGLARDLAHASEQTFSRALADADDNLTAGVRQALKMDEPNNFNPSFDKIMRRWESAHARQGVPLP